MQPGVLKVSQEYRGANKSKCCQLRQFNVHSSQRSNLLHHTEFAIFSGAFSSIHNFLWPHCAPKQSPSSIVSTVCPHGPPLTTEEELSVFLSGPVLAHTLKPLPPASLETLLHQMPVSFPPLQSFLHCFSLFQYFSILKKKK